MSVSNVAYPEVLQSVAFGSITSSYTAIGSAGCANQIRMFRLVNATDGDVFVSLDGVNNHFFLPASSFVLYDLCTNREHAASVFVLPMGTRFYIKYSTAPSQKSFYVEIIYAKGQ